MSTGDLAAPLARRLVPVGLAVAGLVVALDQLVKWWIIAVVMPPPRGIEVTPFFSLVLAQNRGFSFGLFNQQAEGLQGVPVLVAVAIVVLLLIWMAGAGRIHTVVCLCLIVGGALGNVIDRLRYGAVVDFLDFHIGSVAWPAFNVADSAISIGVVLILIDGLFGKRPKA